MVFHFYVVFIIDQIPTLIREIQPVPNPSKTMEDYISLKMPNIDKCLSLKMLAAALFSAQTLVI